MHRTLVPLCLLTASTAAAQTTPDDTLTLSLPVLEVQATRATTSEASAGRSIYVKNREDIVLEPGLSMQRALRGIPGVQINDRGHDALGERLLIRGMGYRAAFGVRGAQVFWDGIPLTVADGQSMLDIVEPSVIARAEVLRGPSSLYWGNSSGGVMFLSSASDTTNFRVRGLMGANVWQLMSAKHTSSLQSYFSTVQRKGWREHSDGIFRRFGVRKRLDFSPSISVNVAVAGAEQNAQAPGSLTAEEFSADPAMADARYVAADAGKESSQLQLGSTTSISTGVGELTVSAYAISRGLYNPLTFTTISLERLAAGTYAQLHNRQKRVSWMLGWDARTQRDNRQNHDDGKLVLNQKERVRSLSASGMLGTKLGGRAQVAFGVRLDAIRFAMSDRFLTNGDQSGTRNMTALSPALDVTYAAGEMVAYANLSTAFETPTTTELVNRPGMDGGFNPDLGPQRTRGLEAGIRGYLPHWRLHTDVALYWMRITDRLLPRQSEDGRTWYVNEGRNDHRGIEIAMTWPLGSPVHLQMAFSGGRYAFLNDPGKGLRIPGVPSLQSHLSVRFTRQGFTAELAADIVSSTWADSNNTARSAGYMAIDLYAGHHGFRVGHVTVQPFLSITNMLDAAYATSLVVNAYGGRYFEPAPGRAAQAGLSLSGLRLPW